MGQTSDKRMIRLWYQSVRWSVVLICAYGLCSTSNGLEDEDCAMGLSSMKQTIRLVDSGDGFTEMVPPEPQLIHIWPNERAILFYQANRPTTQNKVWLYTPPGQEFGYRLKESVSCIEQGTRYIPDPHEETFWINTSESGSYMFAEYDTNWKLAKTTGKHYGRNELYNPLVTFMVLSLEPANIGLTLKMTQFEPFENCTGANEKTEWVFRTLFNMRMFRSVRTDKAMLDGNLTHKVIETKCHLLSDDESPVEIFAYYNIDRTRITSNGVQAHKERKWAVKDKQLDDIQFRDRKEITLPQPFGAGVRIRLVDIILPPISGLRITLITRSEEGMSEGFWGPGNVEPPFPDEQIMPYPFAVVDLNRTIFHQLLANNKSVLDWMLIEPYYGRLRTSTGLMVPFNVKDRWVNGQFLTALKFEAIGNEVTVLEANAHCPPGQYMPYGTPAVCVKCPPGTRSQKLTQNTSFPVYVCDLCPRGMYQDQPGQEDCKRCDPRQSTPRKGSWSRGSCGPNVTTADFVWLNPWNAKPRRNRYVDGRIAIKQVKNRLYDWTTASRREKIPND
ncbi:hypothetical protein FGIG_04515 [Fasciola gigantica]|uniref:Tyrosine-protein kinase ephrin type A/B receptor-like domain-containing protein n=1 Tax=Fasciola gigantica TaxID=46835 RepID=A0A504YLC0_FASGI|nr:hypothetical protein FGIG_04515 [Fasciola gigantica]